MFVFVAVACLSGVFADSAAARQDAAAVRAAERVKPAVVTVQVRGMERQRPEPRMFRFPRGRGRGELPDFEELLPPGMWERQQRPEPAVRTGAGVVIDEEGHILTAASLVRDGEEAEVTLPDGRSVTAEITGADEGMGVALLTLKDSPGGLEPATLGDSDRLRVGQTVLAVGSPPGLPRSVASGIVSALDRSGIETAPFASLIQTDMTLPAGYMGGPLLDLEGNVVGISLGGTEAQYGAGISFAVPIKAVEQMMDDLLAGREVSRGYLGVYITTVGGAMAESFGLEDRRGVLVQEVVSGSPADDAGLEAGDVVLEFDGRRMDSAQDLRAAVAATKPGTTVRLTVWRDGEEMTPSVTIGSREGETASAETDWTGLSVQELTPELAEDFAEEDLRGVLVADVQPGSPAAREQISAGDVVISVNREPAEDVESFRRMIAEAEEEGRVLLRIYDTDQGHRRFVVVRE
jgi:serine protease Do